MSNLILDSDNKMPRYTTTKEDIEGAEKEFAERFKTSNIINQYTVYDRKESRIAGILGEIIFKKLYPNAQRSSDITYDFDLNNYKVDVKCKVRKVKPTPEFQASFFSYQSKNSFNADLYYFMSTTISFEYVWLCGFATKSEILNNPHKEIWKAGQVDTRNGMRFKKDTICLQYKYINSIDIGKLST